MGKAAAGLHKLIYNAFSLIVALFNLVTPNRKTAYWQDWQDRKMPSVEPSFDIVGLFFLSMIRSELPAKQAQELLPRGLELDPSARLPNGNHPALISFGYDMCVRPAIVPSFFGDSYLEFIVFIPSVRLSGNGNGYRGPFTVMTHLELNDLLATILGRILGYPKVCRRMRTTMSSYEIRTLFGNKPLMEAEFQPKGDIGHPFASPAFKPFADFFAQPVVSRSMLGPLLYTRFQPLAEEALFQPLDAKITIHEQDVPGLPAGIHYRKGIHEDTIDAFRLYLPWQMSASLSREKLKGPGN